MKKIKFKDVIIVGFALFAIFFGAGNLIFPPKLGVIAGDRWWQSMLGFLTTDPLLPVMGVIGTALVGGQASGLSKRIGPKFTAFFFTICVLIIGPLFIIPRTAATTHEIAIVRNYPSIPIWLTSVIFMGITLFFAISESGVIDKIGAILTPGLLIALAIIIIKAVVTPIAPMVSTPASGLFLNGFKSGYQTMDALGAALMTKIVIEDLTRRGYDDDKSRIKAVLGVSALCFALLAFIYGGLTYIGAITGNTYTPETGLIEILMGAIHSLLGNIGSTVISVAVALACLTTSVGITAVSAEYFSDLTKNKINYRNMTIIIIFISFFISLVGVEKLVVLAEPILTALYPVIICLIFMSFFNKMILHDLTFTGAVIGTLLISIPQALNLAFGILQGPVEMIKKLPLSAVGLEWLIPAVIVSVLFTIYSVITCKGNESIDFTVKKATAED